MKLIPFPSSWTTTPTPILAIIFLCMKSGETFVFKPHRISSSSIQLHVRHYSVSRKRIILQSSRTKPSLDNSKISAVSFPNSNENEARSEMNGDDGDNKFWDSLQQASDEEDKIVFSIEAAAGLVILACAGVFVSQNPTAARFIQHFLETNPTETLQSVVDHVADMGTDGILYFATIYTIAEVLAIPATPLTASAGYLFGLQTGTAVVLCSASIAASMSFLLARTFLREKVEEWLKSYPQFQKIDKAIEKNGFQLMLLLRLSPLFPFALSNYLYGVTRIKFWEYFFGTMLGFLPGTIAYVYTGEIGKELLTTSNHQPWYVYAGGMLVLGAVLKVAADVATGIIKEMDDVEEDAVSG